MHRRSRLMAWERFAWWLLLLAAATLWQNSAAIERAVRRFVRGPTMTPAGVCPACCGRPSETRLLGGNVDAVDLTCGTCGERWLKTRSKDNGQLTTDN
jgi:hypothetical protein